MGESSARGTRNCIQHVYSFIKKRVLAILSICLVLFERNLQEDGAVLIFGRLCDSLVQSPTQIHVRPPADFMSVH